MIRPATQKAFERLVGERVAFDAPLSRETSLRIGGPADALITPSDREELAKVLSLCHAEGLRTTILGAGFNVLVREKGIRGVVLRLKKLRSIERASASEIDVEAGASHATITKYCIENQLSGLEFGAGIPGTLGGWIKMNAGIGVREMKDVVRGVEILEATGARARCIPRGELDFQYRSLSGLPSGSVVTRARFAVAPSERTVVQAEVDRLLALRQTTQPTDIPSCGSVFRNPRGDFAGRLIEAAGLKGLREGGAEISTVHANFIVNRGGATARDVMTLIERAQEAVRANCGIELETEVVLLGEEAEER